LLVLGIIDSKPSTVAIVDEGRILAAVAEERLCRKKMATGMPRQAIAEVLRLAGAAPSDIDRVAVAQMVSVFEPEPQPWSGWFDGDIALTQSGFDKIGSTLAPLLGGIPLALKTHHELKKIVFRERRTLLPRILRDDFGITAPARFYDHHYAHATSAYYTSDFDETLVVTLDGGGDGLSGSVYAGRDGQLKKLGDVDSFHSLGNFYSYITALCGFKAERHEGKITGLAAYGKPDYADILRDFIEYRDPGRIRYRIPMYHRSALVKLRERLPADFDRADLAASVQLVLEEVGVAFVRYWLRKTGLRRVALAGGVFANVKFNQRIHQLEEVDELVIHPAMDDGGLAVGAAFAELARGRGKEASKLIRRLPNAYLGPEFDADTIADSIQRSGCKVQRDDAIHESIATLIDRGHVVARFAGRKRLAQRATPAHRVHALRAGDAGRAGGPLLSQSQRRA